MGMLKAIPAHLYSGRLQRVVILLQRVVDITTLGVDGVGPRCRLLASDGKVSAAKATDPKLDNS